MIKVTAIGRLTKDIVLLRTKKGKPIINFQIASRTLQGEVEFLNCAAFDVKAETIAKTCKKGTMLFISGVFSVTGNETVGKKPTVIVGECEFFVHRDDPNALETQDKIDLGISDAKAEDLPF